MCVVCTLNMPVKDTQRKENMKPLLGLGAEVTEVLL